jgi:predicted chitinase
MVTREQLLSLFTLLRNLRWIIILSLAISLLLFLPAQVQELYRIAAADYGWATAKEFFAFAVIAVVIWLGAFQLTTETLPLNADRQLGFYRAAPIVLGALPIVGAIIGQIVSRPHEIRAEDVGSIFRIENQALAFERNVLWVLTALGVVLLVCFVIVGLWASAKARAVTISRSANAVYFRPFRFFPITVVAITLLTTAFIWLPDSIAQFVGTIGVIALFTMSVVGVTLHFALLTIEQGVPYIPLVFGTLFGLTALSGCDNHELRPAVVNLAGDARMSAADAFRDWLKQPARIADAARLGEYPVFIVTAQGGGIYAAHNAARFLAKIQDLCPSFRQHLFAISAVSGGSVGAATFAAALHADNDSLKNNTPAGQACDKIASFLNGVTRAQDLNVPGVVEQRVADILKTDFVAPLAAGFLFSDFTQLFTPVSFSFLDRARFLEYALENASDTMIKHDKSAVDQSNLLRADFQSHWASDNSMPALLLNTTDVGSGKRVVIAPFDIDPSHPKSTDLCTLAKLKRSADGASVTSESLHIPLSTAAFASARFPWLTPAATVTLANDCITEKPEARLVDGGYVENSGIETALELIRQIKRIQGSSDLPNFRIYLLSLANGDFDDHGSFRFGELMEPIRALFSTQGARTYIAINRALYIDGLTSEDATAQAPSFPTFGRAEIAGRFYNLPLGWTLSRETGDIIALGSGRFWDCIPNDTFDQSRPEQSNADCLQVKVYHLLNGDVPSAFQTLKDSKLAAAAYADQLAKEKPPGVKIPTQPLLACYEKKWLQDRAYQKYVAEIESYATRVTKALQDHTPPPMPVPPYRKRYLAYFQTDQIKALLQEWDRVEESDPRILSYILGSVSYDSEDFTHTSENFWFNDISKIPQKWRQRIDWNNAARAAAGMPLIDITSLLGHPKELANAAFGYDTPDSGGKPNLFGNRPGTDDGWNFRLRGMYQLVGLEQYQEAQKQMKKLNQLPGLDLITFPDALWDAKISAKITFAHFRLHRYQGGRTLFDLLKDSSLNWRAVRVLQTDMDHAPSDQANVSMRSDMFQSCIGDVWQPPLLETWASQFRGEQQ